MRITTKNIFDILNWRGPNTFLTNMTLTIIISYNNNVERVGNQTQTIVNR